MTTQDSPWEGHPAFSIDPATLRRLVEAANRVAMPSNYAQVAESARELLKNIPTSPELEKSIDRVWQVITRTLYSELPDGLMAEFHTQLPADRLEQIRAAASGITEALPPDSHLQLSDELAAAIFDDDEVPSSPDRRLSTKQFSRVKTFLGAWGGGFGVSMESLDRLVGPDDYPGQSITWGAILGLIIAIVFIYGVDRFGPNDDQST
ncbi:hypothetical protein ACFP63_08715 [Oerskovia jenensis]|uniref:Uncharacterized protein n=1 Tax=Oerskovia jenensis TaxID=162169 RepID=A0ABS2LI80_9CELL|nr:hypothetical protein [Oerskovia jenensis]MBM7480133.1 hypothetical protein [Oerskovia jenensis]